MAAQTKATVTAHVVDFTNTQDKGQSFNKKRVPAGDYLAKVTAVVDAPSKKDGVHQWLYSIELVDKYTDRTFPYYCKLVENQLWKLRNLFLAAGIPVPKKKVKLDPGRIVGKLIAVTLEDDEYEGKAQSNIAATFPANELDDVENTEEDEEYDDEETDDEEAEDETDEEADDEEEEEEPAPAPRKAAARKAAVPAQRKKAAARPEVSDDELEELDLDDI